MNAHSEDTGALTETEESFEMENAPLTILHAGVSLKVKECASH